jgi:transcriptional regulator with XRE-family HTH domain
VNSSRTEHPTIDAIKAEMIAQGISKLELARRLGWGRMRVTRRLFGDAPLTVIELEEIAAALRVPVTALLQGEEGQ